MVYPWDFLHEWQPFKIDALGLVTLLGAQDVDNAIGRLVPSQWLEYMPLLAGYVIASDQFRQKKPAFNWYNISSGIHTTDISGWFSRWLMAQDFADTRSIVWWEVSHSHRGRRRGVHCLIAAAVSCCTTGMLIALAVLSRDWYGVANALSLSVSIVVRAYILQANRAAIDAAIHEVEKNSEKGESWDHHVKTLLILPTSNVVTVMVPENLIRSVFVCNPTPRRAWLYQLAQGIGWIAFGIHVVCLGMAQLASQLCTTALLILSTVLVCYRVGCDDFQGFSRQTNTNERAACSPYTCWMGSRLQASVLEWPAEADFVKDKGGKWRQRQPGDTEPRSARRQDLYAWLNPSNEEEQSMAKWDLLPHSRGNATWLDDFQAKKDLVYADPVDIGHLLQSLSSSGGIYSGTLGSRQGDEEDIGTVRTMHGEVTTSEQPLKASSTSSAIG
ncbi:hypothetical protein BJX70DRAFT_378999 [Aspergillus crustosus]